LLAEQGARALVLCGPGRSAELSAAEAAWPDTLVVREHCAEMGAAYSAADFALTRGGASTVAELWLHALPAVIVPYPHHRDRQQERNAVALAPGLAVIREENLDAAALARVAAATMEPALRGPMRAHLESLRARVGDGREQAVRALEEIAVSSA
ncbi:MAG: glycosyltransferase, partial [Planctomycetota bacterium]|nr:glycosyltransferase [Planctomycetota bacterium]